MSDTAVLWSVRAARYVLFLSGRSDGQNYDILDVLQFRGPNFG